jgi:hypothetical protein
MIHLRSTRWLTRQTGTFATFATHTTGNGRLVWGCASTALSSCHRKPVQFKLTTPLSCASAGLVFSYLYTRPAGSTGAWQERAHYHNIVSADC